MEGPEFEVSVRRIAHARWSDDGGGAVMLGGKERDGVYVTEDVVHIIEATISRSKDKALTDGKKLAEAIREYNKKFPDRMAKGWFITQSEPTAEQRSAIQNLNAPITVVGFDVFRSKLVDVRGYLEARQRYAFGSAADLNTRSKVDVREEYIGLDYSDQSSHSTLSMSDLYSQVCTGRRILLLGSFGSGKSMTLREIHKRLRSDYFNGKTHKFPVYLNLNDHVGQPTPAEAIDRHCRNLGFPRPHDVVRSWRAGECYVLLDGFDELAVVGWVGHTKKLRALRHQSMTFVRKFIEESPTDSSIVVAGRDNYFDSDFEMFECLGVQSNWLVLQVRDFSEDQIREFLKKKDMPDIILPEWFPSKPYLLGVLISRGIISGSTNFSSVSEAQGWNLLLERIAEREAAAGQTLEPITVKRIIEILGSIARTTPSGLGPLSTEDLRKAFEKANGTPPDHGGYVLLQRLAVLSRRMTPREESRHEESSENQTVDYAEGGRSFISEDFANVAAAADVSAFVLSPFSDEPYDAKDWLSPLSELGIRALDNACRCQSGEIEIAMRRSSDIGLNQLTGDLLQLILARKGRITKPLKISSVMFDNLLFDDDIQDFSIITLSDCVIGTLEVGPKALNERLPRLHDCSITLLRGRQGARDVPESWISSRNPCDIGKFEAADMTTASIMSIKAPLPVRVFLTILKKIYMQRGTGRRENALKKGLGIEAVVYVEDILDMMRKHNFTVRSPMADSEPVWHPVRSMRPRVSSILNSPHASDDPLLREVRGLA